MNKQSPPLFFCSLLLTQFPYLRQNHDDHDADGGGDDDHDDDGDGGQLQYHFDQHCDMLGIRIKNI